jgi:superfamily II DNA or RNA helicase
LKFDLSRVKKTAGDYNEKALYEEFEKNFTYGNLVSEWKKRAENKRTVVFAINVEHSKQIVETYLKEGITAEHIDGKTPTAERDSIFKRFAEGRTMILSNVGVATEGVDIPAIEAVQLVRPTKSLIIYLQTVGRALRPAKDKERAIIMDHANCVFEHGFPDEDREWTLEGSKIKESNKEKQMFIKSPSTGQIYKADDVKTGNLPEHLDDIELIEVDLTQQSIIEMRKLIVEGKKKGFKRGWAWYRFLDKFPKPNETDIMMFAQMAGYKNGWIKYKFKDFGYSL